jgi:microcystin-dependent protein
MAEPFLAELRLMSFAFPPKGWAFCDGQLLAINTNQALFSLLGTTYGGDGRTTFGLPDLRGRTPVHMGAGLTLGQRLGEEFHTVTISEMPEHTHAVQASRTTANAAAPGVLAAAGNAYRTGSPGVSLHPATTATVGGSQPHENRPPSLVLGWCIATQGIFPSET